MAVQNPQGPPESPGKAGAGFLGKHVGNYVIKRLLGEGGMGEVFVAEHPTLGRNVAVKFLARRFHTDPSVADRFMAEARTLASLRHPHIVDIFDFGELDGRLYYVMEHLQGDDLEAVMKRHGRFTARELGPYVQQICSALEAAHARNVVHRDLKPANIFVLQGDSLRLKLMDFGIAKVVHGEARVSMTGTGQVLGTPTHMAPEQALGHRDWICAQTDLYAVGAILYEMLAGRPVFQHSSVVMLLSAHVRDPVTPLRAIDPSIPEPVARLVEQCLNKHPQDRPQSARVLATRFQDALLVAGEIGPSAAPALPNMSNGGGVATLPDGPEIEVVYSSEVHEAAVSVTGLTTPAPPLAPAPVTGPAPKARSASVRPRKSKRPPRTSAAPPAAKAGVRAPAAALPTAAVALSPAAVTAVLPSSEDAATPQSAEAPSKAEDTAISEGESAAIANVLARMQRAGDFPAFVKNVSVISRKADVEGDASADQLGDAILKDYALTAKLLRVVNSSFYDRFGKKINNVSRAVVVLGFEQVRSLALGISIFRNPGNKPHARQLADLSISALVSGEIARNVAKSAGLRDGEEAMICSMFQNLGHHLVVYYLPEAYEKIIGVMQAESVDVETAAQRVLGVSLRKLGIGVVQKWRLSPRIIAAMVPGPPGESKPKSDEERLRLLSSFANELCEAVATTSADKREAVLAPLLERYKHVVTLRSDKVDEFLGAVQKSFTERYSCLLGLNPQGSRFFQSAEAWQRASRETPDAPVLHKDVPKGGPILRQGHPAVQAAANTSDAGSSVIARRIEAIAAKLNGRHHADEALKAVLDAYVFGLGFRRMLALMADRKHAKLVVRGASGEDADVLRREFTLPLAPLGAGDVFSSSYHGMKATVVTDAFDDKMTKRVPRLYYEMIGSPAFAVYPCGGRGLPVTLLFGDVDSEDQLPKPDQQVHLVRLRELVGRIALVAPNERVLKSYG